MNIEKTSEQKSVVECGECFWCYIKDLTVGVCENRWGMNGSVKPDDYCSRGRKREQVPKHQGQ